MIFQYPVSKKYMLSCVAGAPPLDLANLRVSVVKPGDVYDDPSHSLRSKDEDCLPYAR